MSRRRPVLSLRSRQSVYPARIFARCWRDGIAPSMSRCKRPGFDFAGCVVPLCNHIATLHRHVKVGEKNWRAMSRTCRSGTGSLALPADMPRPATLPRRIRPGVTAGGRCCVLQPIYLLVQLLNRTPLAGGPRYPVAYRQHSATDKRRDAAGARSIASIPTKRAFNR